MSGLIDEVKVLDWALSLESIASEAIIPGEDHGY